MMYMKRRFDGFSFPPLVLRSCWTYQKSRSETGFVLGGLCGHSHVPRPEVTRPAKTGDDICPCVYDLVGWISG